MYIVKRLVIVGNVSLKNKYAIPVNGDFLFLPAIESNPRLPSPKPPVRIKLTFVVYETTVLLHPSPLKPPPGFEPGTFTLRKCCSAS